MKTRSGGRLGATPERTTGSRREAWRAVGLAILGAVTLAAPAARADGPSAAPPRVPAAPQPEGPRGYDLVLLGPEDVAWGGSAALGISNGGKITGFVQKNAATVVSLRAVWDVTTPGAPIQADPGSGAYVGLNAAGQPFGYDAPTYPGYPSAHPLWDTGGNLWLGTAGVRAVGYRSAGLSTRAVASWVNLAQPPQGQAVAFAVNASGVTVGAVGPALDRMRPVKWAPNGMSAPLPLSATVGAGSAFDVGSGAALAINDAGHVVGWSAPGQGPARATLWTSDGPATLGTLGQKSVAVAINATGTVVGWFKDASGGRRAFVGRRGAMTDLNAMVHRAPGQADWLVSQAFGVNDQGLICGIALRPGSAPRAVVLKPRTATVTVSSADAIEQLARRVTAARPPTSAASAPASLPDF